MDFVVLAITNGLATAIGRLYLNQRLLDHLARRGIPVYLDLQGAVEIMHPAVDSLAGIQLEY